MTKQIRLLTLLVLGPHPAAKAVTIPAQTETSMTVKVFNIAHVPADTLAHAKHESTRLFAQAGIGVTWLDGDPDAGEAWSVDFSAWTCSEFLRSTELMLTITPATPESVRPEALGMALPCAKFGPQATIFWDRVRSSRPSVLAPIGKILGYAMSHEIGHVLLRSRDHSAAGLMHGVWGEREWKGVAESTLAFTPVEITWMTRAVRLTNRRSRENGLPQTDADLHRCSDPRCREYSPGVAGGK